MFKPCCMVAVACVTLCGPAAADILHVPGDYRTIQEAIDAAMDGDEVEVHPGTYNETIDFLGKAIAVRSSDGPQVTIIDASGILCGGDGNSDCCVANGTPGCDDPECLAKVCDINPACCIAWDALCAQIANKVCAVCSEKQGAVSCINGEGSATILDGFTITGAICSGMYNNNTNPTVTNCTFSGNTADSGGGMYNVSSSPTVTNCTFSGNTVSPGPFDAGGGGGMYNFSSNPTVTNCTFSGNTVSGGGSSRGGGMYNVSSNPTVTNCTFSGNTANSGGGMHNFTSNPTVTNCSFSGNTATFNGGGMYNFTSNPTVTNCTFSGNTANSGGGIYNFRNPTVTNSSSNPTVTNAILWDNSPNQIVDVGKSVTTVSYSDVQGGWTGSGNIDADPLFVDPDNGDYRLASGSPCIDAGNNWGVPIDANDYDQDGNTAELFPVDLDGNPRFNADEADFDPGCGVPVVVDMGAYEYQFNPVEEVIFADLNADGVVGILDLLGVLAAWGDPGTNCLADLDIDGDVDIFDLLTLLAHWG